MRKALLIATLFTGLAGATGASAQNYYNGWNVGPVTDGMMQDALRRQAELGQRIRQGQAEATRHAMQDPRCQALYRQHLAAGGQSPWPQFAHDCAATAYFSPDGIARYRAAEADNMAGERRAYDGYRRAQDERGRAQNGYAESYGRGQAELGRVMQGQASWRDPVSGQPVALPYLQPGQPSRDPRTGRLYVMDGRGTYYAQDPNGQWVPMAPVH